MAGLCSHLTVTVGSLSCVGGGHLRCSGWCTGVAPHCLHDGCLPVSRLWRADDVFNLIAVTPTVGPGTATMIHVTVSMYVRTSPEAKNTSILLPSVHLKPN